MNSPNRILTKTENEIIKDRPTPVVISQPAPQWIDTGGPTGISGIAAYLEVPFMHKRLILICSLLGILVAWLAIFASPRSYESVAKLMVKVGRENVSLDPTATTGSALMSVQKSKEEEITSALEVLKSRHVAEGVVDALGVDAIMRGELPKAAAAEAAAEVDEGIVAIASERLASVRTMVDKWLHDCMLRAGVKDSISDRELAIMRVQSSVDIDSPKNTKVLVIQGRAPNPHMAQAIVANVTETFVEEQLKAAHTDGSYEFFEQQSVDLEKELNELVAARAKFMQDQQVVSIEANRNMLSSQLSGIDRDLAIASGQLEQAVAEVDDLKTKLVAAADEVVARKVQASDGTWSGMRQQVYELELEEQNLAANFTDEHPRLRRVRSQLKGAKEILAELDSERIDESMTPNPIKTGLQEDLQQKQTFVVGLRSMIEEKQNQQRELQQQARALLEKERHLTQVDRDIELKTANLRIMREKHEEARVIEELHTNKFSNIHVFQPASFVERAASPNKKVLGLGFVFLGFLTGLALSFLREGSSPMLRTSYDVESRLGIPVISSIPRLKRMKSPRLKEKRTYRRKCQELMAEILMSQHRPGQARGRSLGVIGVDVGAGATTLAVNLAIAGNNDCNMKTVLVDADSRTRSVSKMFGLNGAPGLVELVSGTASHDECLQKMKKPEIDLIASSADSCDHLLSSSAAEIAQALQAYLQDCDLLIVDLPAASQPDQAVALAQHLDCILVVAESEKSQTTATDRLLNRLSQSDTEIVGVVLTKTRSYLPRFIQSFVAPQV